MKAIRNWNDLDQFGIRILTGEACRYGTRLLCDLTPRGVQLIEEYLGAKLVLAENMNSGAVASIMLPRTICLELATFCLLQSGAENVLVSAGEVQGIDDDRLARYRDMGEEFMRDYHVVSSKRNCGPAVGSRMVHQFTGRSS